MTFPTTKDMCGIETCRRHQVVACLGIPPCDELRCPFRARCLVGPLSQGVVRRSELKAVLALRAEDPDERFVLIDFP